VLDTLQATRIAARNRRDIPMLGACLELGAAAHGTLMGPLALRTAGLARVLAELGHRVSDRGTLHEAETVAVAMEPRHAERCRNLSEIAGWTRRLHDHAYAMAGEGGVPIFLGGDHSVSMGSISGVARRCAETGRELVILWLDAHADYNTPETTPSGNMHGMALAFLAGEPSLRPLLGSRPFHPVPAERIHVFGARSIDPEEKVRLQADAIDTVDMRQIDERGVSALLAERIARWRERGVHLHVSFDVDFLDPRDSSARSTWWN
jgi:arginase